MGALSLHSALHIFSYWWGPYRSARLAANLCGQPRFTKVIHTFFYCDLYVAQKKRAVEIVNPHLPSHDLACVMRRVRCLRQCELLTHSLQTHTSHSCTWRHDVPDMFSNMGDSWPNTPSWKCLADHPRHHAAHFKRQARKASPWIRQLL